MPITVDNAATYAHNNLSASRELVYQTVPQTKHIFVKKAVLIFKKTEKTAEAVERLAKTVNSALMDFAK